jgi:transcriptional regulator with XRE-family HTH domain
MFGDRVRNRRCFLRLSKSELARRVGVKPQTLTAVESNQTQQMKPANLFKLADVLHVDARELALDPHRRFRARRNSVVNSSIPRNALDARCQRWLTRDVSLERLQLIGRKEQ